MFSRRGVLALSAATAIMPTKPFAQDIGGGSSFTIGGPATLDIIPDGVYTFNAERNQWPDIALNLPSGEITLDAYAQQLEAAGMSRWFNPEMPFVMTRNPELFPGITPDVLGEVQRLEELEIYTADQDGFRYEYVCLLLAYGCICVSA